MCEWDNRTITAERVGEGSSSRIRSSPVSMIEKVRDVLRPRASSISVASTSRTAPLSVNRPSPLREKGVVPDPLVPRSISRPSPARIWANRNPRPSPISGIVNAELVPVILERERLGQIALRAVRNRPKWRAFHCLIAEPIKAHFLVPLDHCASADGCAGNSPGSTTSAPSHSDSERIAVSGRYLAACGSELIPR